MTARESFPLGFSATGLQEKALQTDMMEIAESKSISLVLICLSRYIFLSSCEIETMSKVTSEWDGGVNPPPS